MTDTDTGPAVDTRADRAPGLDDLIHRDQRAISCPYPIFRELRSERPVHFSDELGAWVVTRYDDVLAVLHDTDRFSSSMPTGPQRVDSILAETMATLSQDPDMAETFAAVMDQRNLAAVLLNADPPDHRRQRKLVNGAFRPSRMKAMEPTIDQVARRLLDDFASRGEVEFVSEFAVGLPMTIIAYALGVGDDDLDTFKRWSDDLVMPVGNHSPSLEQARGYLTSSKAFADFFREMLADRRRAPQDDIVSDVANAELDGEHLTEAEMLSMLQQFLVAGNETTTKLITNIGHHLAIDPAMQAEVRADRSLIDGLVEEALRYEAPVGGLFRRAKVDVDVGGVEVSKGDHVWILYASANRDDDKFADADRFDVCRENARDHVAFGHGEHFCIGAALARAEARIGTDRMLDRMGDIRLAEGRNDFAYEDTFVLRGMKRLYLEFTPLT